MRLQRLKVTVNPMYSRQVCVVDMTSQNLGEGSTNSPALLASICGSERILLIDTKGVASFQELDLQLILSICDCSDNTEHGANHPRAGVGGHTGFRRCCDKAGRRCTARTV